MIPVLVDRMALGTSLGDRFLAAKQPRSGARAGGLLPVAVCAAISLLAVVHFGQAAPRPEADGGGAHPPSTSGSSAGSAAAPVLAGQSGGLASLSHADPAANPSFAEARQMRELFAEPPEDAEACGYSGSTLPMLSPALVRAHSRRGVLFGALATSGLRDMLVNFVSHLAPLAGPCSTLIGMMDGGEPALTLRLRFAVQVGVYTTGEPLPAEGGQAGRWRHARALFAAASAAGADLVLSDVDVVWLRDPWPYFRAAYARDEALDGLISTDSTSDWTKPLPAHPRMALGSGELQLEAADACGRSLNIGLLALRAGRPGAEALVAAASEAVAGMKAGDIDQGAINRRWKGPAGAREAAGVRGAGCPLLGGTARLGVLPAAQFLSLLGYSVRRLHVLRAVEPMAVHATFLRAQEPAGKLLRLREEGLFLDPPAHYSSGSFLVYTPHVPPEALVQPPIARGAIPHAHMALVNAQLAQLREALAIARVLGRSLVLPRMRCACELGFGPGHVTQTCDASSAITLPYDCPLDHWLRPSQWLSLGWPHRERGFLDNPRVPDEVQRSRAHARLCQHNRISGCCLHATQPVGEAELRSQLGGCSARILEMGAVSNVFSGFADARAASDFDASLAKAASSWCCTTDPAFKHRGGLVPYNMSVRRSL